MEVLVPQWLTVKDVNGVVKAIREYWGSDPEPSNDELFTTARCNWENAKDDDAAKRFVLQVVANGLEDQLVMWLLQLHFVDAADSIQMLFNVCQDSYFSTEGLELLGALLDALLSTAVVQAAGCDPSAAQQSSQRGKLLGIMEEKIFLKMKARVVVRALKGIDGEPNGADIFRQFIELPYTLDHRLFNSRSGRAFVDAAEQVVVLQQMQLAAVCEALENRTSVNTDESTGETAKILWHLTDQIVKTIQDVAALDGGVDQANGLARTSSASVLPKLVNMFGLEEFLKVKASTTMLNTDELLDDEMCSDDEDAELSAMEQLSAALNNGEKPISSVLLENVFGELSTIKSLEVLTVHSSFLLGIQMRQKRCLVDECDSVRSAFERRVRSVFNRLTGKAEDQQHAILLVRLAAFCPQQVINQMFHGARTDVLHHSLYLEVLHVFPLLLDWKEATDDGAATFFERELQGALFDIASSQNCFDRESQNIITFLLSLTGIPTTKSSTFKSPVVSVEGVIHGILSPLCSTDLTSSGDCVANNSVQTQINLFTMIQLLFEKFVATARNVGKVVDPALLSNMFGQVSAKLGSVISDVSRNGVILRERLLFLLKNIMELVSDPDSIITLEGLIRPLDASLWTLISLFSNKLDHYEHCTGKSDMLTVEACVKMKVEDGHPPSVPLSTASNAIYVLLWRLLWSALAEQVTSGLRIDMWRCLDIIAGDDFHESDLAQSSVKGNVLIQAAVAKMMFVCGSALFQPLYNKIIPFLLEYGSVDTEKVQEELLVVPKWTTAMLLQQPKCVSHLPCQLMSTHLIMSYVVKCWAISTSVNNQLLTPKLELVVESLIHVLGTLDKAATSSQRELSGTLYCIQWLCFLVSAAFELRLDAMPAWPTIRMQLDLTLLRLLHQLDQLKTIPTDEARFSQNFVAAWLVHVPVGHFGQVFNFLASRMGK